jgi:phytoene dehydrogenase-like protein
MDHAFADARLTGMSRAPIVEMLIPSTLDASLAPKGAHVASLFCQHFSYKLPGRRDWRQERQRAVDLIFSTVESYAPNFRASVVGHSALSPIDLEETFGLAGGDIFHGALGLGATDVRLRRLPHATEKLVLVRLWCTSGRRSHGNSRTQCRARNAARWHRQWAERRC